MLKILFSQPQTGILEVALLYGYNSNEAFTRAFEQVWNCTPSEFESQNGNTFTSEDKEIPLSLYVLSSTLEKGSHGDNSEMFGQFQQTINEFKKTLLHRPQA